MISSTRIGFKKKKKYITFLSGRLYNIVQDLAGTHRRIIPAAHVHIYIVIYNNRYNARHLDDSASRRVILSRDDHIILL